MNMSRIGAAVVIASLSMAARAQPPDAFDTCAQEKDAAARLACFDRVTAARHGVASSNSVGAPAAPAPTSAPAPATAASAPTVTEIAATATKAAATPAPTAAPAAAANSDVGLDARQARKERRERGEAEPTKPAPIVARVVRVIPRQPLISAFELDNGQIWEQSEAMRFSAEPQDEVTIRHGMLGSFFLKGAHGISVRVHRLK